MADRSTPAPGNVRPEGLAPETHNAEQDTRGNQAQDVAVDARMAPSHQPGGTESRKAPSPGVDNIGGNETDLVDEMRRMENEGIIDNSAYVGEPNHDDEAGRYDAGNNGIDDVVIGGESGARSNRKPRE